MGWGSDGSEVMAGQDGRFGVDCNPLRIGDALISVSQKELNGFLRLRPPVMLTSYSPCGLHGIHTSDFDSP